MAQTKIATCCYCGARAALELRGKHRHELSCSQCGAPLRRMKSLPTATVVRSETRHYHPDVTQARHRAQRRPGFARRVLAQVWDEIEDLFD